MEHDSPWKEVVGNYLTNWKRRHNFKQEKSE
jgi:hypothetical protein